MPTPITPISLPLPLGMGTVNCYLLEAGEGYVLVDTGPPTARVRMQRCLEEAGCLPGRLSLVLLTHGDFDHTGNAAHLRRALGVPIGMHADDAPMAETGDMFANRQRANALLRAMLPRVVGFGRHERFTPDILLGEGASLGGYGLAARVVSLPGHSRGSIGVVTSDGDFLCGDLLENTRLPRPGSIVDDRQAMSASLARVRDLAICRIFPGHGAPFSVEELLAG